jgi:hypothetical protein
LQDLRPPKNISTSILLPGRPKQFGEPLKSFSKQCDFGNVYYYSLLRVKISFRSHTFTDHESSKLHMRVCALFPPKLSNYEYSSEWKLFKKSCGIRMKHKVCIQCK